jgi:hypothetical protein
MRRPTMENQKVETLEELLDDLWGLAREAGYIVRIYMASPNLWVSCMVEDCECDTIARGSGQALSQAARLCRADLEKALQEGVRKTPEQLRAKAREAACEAINDVGVIFGDERIAAMRQRGKTDAQIVEMLRQEILGAAFGLEADDDE